MHKPPLDTLQHYGIKRKSGRYPWGSGKDPYQSENWAIFLRKYEELNAQKLSQVEIAKRFNMNTTELRNNITWSRREQKDYLSKAINKMIHEGLSNTEIGRRLGVSEGTIRNHKSNKKPHKELQWENVTKSIEDGVNKTGYLDIGVGVERQLEVPRNMFNSVVNQLVKEKGYYIHYRQVPRLNDPNKKTTIKVLSKESDIKKVIENTDKIRSLDVWSDDGSQTLHRFRDPQMVSLDRVHIRYAEDGGKFKDGLIELRPGVKDLDLKNSKYAQVRIGAGKDLYMKGMAVYADPSDFPSGKDIIYNVTKPRGTPVEDTLKKMKVGTDNPFGATIKQNGQRGALNLINEEGDWDSWSTKMSSQFLSKQPTSLVKDRLNETHDILKGEYEEIMSLTNPVVKEYLLQKYSDGLDSKASHLKAQGLPRTKNHVILPSTDISPNEIYAPRYRDGENVVLVRHPHGGTFEIPSLRVNNRNPSARKIMGSKAPDAVVIHPSMAEKLSGADFDGDTVLVIPNNSGQVKATRSLKELENFDPMSYQVNRKTITSDDVTQMQMGIVSNLITDMTIKGASQPEIARAVKHSMVVIDAAKHNLDYKQSAIDNRISDLRKQYQTRVNPETGRKSMGASTIISRSKSKVKISDPTFNIKDHSSNTAVEDIYADYIGKVQGLKNESTKSLKNIKIPSKSPEAAKVYESEVQSLNVKLNEALLNAPRERQAQILSNKLYYSNVTPEMDRDDKKKLKTRSLAQARVETGAKRADIKITDKEWEAIQNRAISKTKLKQILDNTNLDRIKELAQPRQIQISPAKLSRAKGLLDKGYTYSEVAERLGISVSTIRESLK